MTKMEAAEIVATNVIAWSRKTGHAITKDLVEARMSEMRVTATPGTYAHIASHLANWRTTLKIAKGF